MDNKLAIIIPAYKARYLHDCLQSIAHQTNRRFTLYIGDDASPENLEYIIEPFYDRLSIQYTRFEENLGGYNLVNHWHRCIQMSHEPWIWLFSDDDRMGPTAVDAFYQALENTQESYDLYHFNTRMIDKDGRTFLTSKSFPKEIGSADYLKMLLRGGYFTFAVEYIFRRQTYIECEGFVQIDLAWGSDSATWLKFMRDSKMYTISSPRIEWRFSGDNISSIRKDVVIAERKILADLYFLQWALLFLHKSNLPDVSSKYDKISWIVRQLHEKKHLSAIKRRKLIRLYLKRIDLEQDYPLACLLYFLYDAKSRVRGVLSRSVQKKSAV